MSTLTRRRPPRGFTLLETMLASTIFLAGFAGVTAMQAQGAKQLAAAGRKEHATQIASSLVEFGRLMPLAELQALGTASLLYDARGNHLLKAGQPPFYSATVVVTTETIPNDIVYNFRAVVQWTEPFARQPTSVAVESTLPSS